MLAVAGSPITSVTPMSPSAPGTSSQYAGRNVTCGGGAPGRRATASAIGVIVSAPKKPLTSAPTTRSPISWPIQAQSSTSISQGSAPGGAEKYSAAAAITRQATMRISRLVLLSRRPPSSVTVTMSSIRTPKRSGR
jgi:hypothetical protein